MTPEQERSLCCAITKRGPACRRPKRGRGYALCTQHLVGAKFGHRRDHLTTDSTEEK